MYHCYLDDSGGTDMRIATMAGFVATAEDWSKLELDWDEILKKYDIPILHAKEFNDGRHPFTTWSKSKRRQLADDLFSSAKEKMGGVSVAVRRVDVAKTKTELKKLQEMSPIGICFALIMHQLVQKLHPTVMEKGLSFFVESGNSNNAEIKKYFQNMGKAKALAPALKEINFIDKNSCRAIQIADFLAFYSRRRLQKYDITNGKLLLPNCQFLDIIERYVPIWIRHISGQPDFTNTNIANVDDISAFYRQLTA
jgi:Protein of unknown function (DUF3800)